MFWQTPLPREYQAMDDPTVASAIAARKAQLGRKLVILGHHYQQDEVIQHADFTGDSFKLSQLAAGQVRQAGSAYVVFCGVHFMAESADILAPQGTTVILPDLGAGCSMADMASLDDVADAWDQLHRALDRQGLAGQTRLIPVTYMNSSAAIKAFVGQRGGAVCTSSNARTVLEWAFAGGPEPLDPGQSVKVLFLPDQHLGRNTAAAMGYDVRTRMCLWDPRVDDPLGGTTPADIARSDIILWKGHCSVHMLFRPEHVDQARAADPTVKVIVHPECRHEVVLKSDMTGSTEGILQAVGQAPPGSHWAVGTEVHLVNRLARQAAERGVSVRILSECQCLCTTMYRIDARHLLWALDNLAAGHVVNPIRVDDQTRRWSLLALQRMLQITERQRQPITTPD